MSNQVLLWTILILPWLTVFFLKKGNFKRFISTALLTIVLTMVIVQVGTTLKWWEVKEMPYPLHTLPNVLGLNPVMLIWILQFTYGRFLLYLATEIVTNLIFAYLYLGYFMRIMNIFQFVGGGPIRVFLITTIVGILLYCFQMWHEGTPPPHHKER